MGHSMRKVLLTFLPAFLIVLLSFFAAKTQAFASDDIGSITICKAITDQNNVITDGSQVPGQNFTISGFVPNPLPIDGVPAGALPTSSFTTPLTLNTKIFSDSVGNDSQCVTYSNLALGAYYYTQETTPASGWELPLYNDQFNAMVSHVSDVFSYDGRLFASDQSTVDQRNVNADGSIILKEDRPNRTLVVVNKMAFVPQPTATPTQTPSNNNNGGNGGGGSSGPTVCTDTAPASAPAITNVVYGTNSVTLTWTKAADPVSYYLIAYGTQPGVYQWGNPNVGGPDTTSYTINGLSGGTTYYFVVRAGNGCKPGTYSNEVSTTPSGGSTNGLPAGFAAGVLGAKTAVDSINTQKQTIVAAICGRCIWWPVLLAEIAVLFIFYMLFRRRILKVNKLVVGFGIALVAYIVFLVVNQGKCPLGIMDLKIIQIPCRYFWVLDGLAYILISFLTRFRKQTKKEGVNPTKNTFKKTSKKKSK